jgi:hypothetical protein
MQGSGAAAQPRRPHAARCPALVVLLLAVAAGAAAAAAPATPYAAAAIAPKAAATRTGRDLLAQEVAAWSACGGFNGPGGDDAAGASCASGYECMRMDE